MTLDAQPRQHCALSGTEPAVSSDIELVNRAKAGDPESFSELVRRHQQAVYNLSYRFVRDASLAEDMAQEAFLKGYRLLHGFRGDCSFGTWMYRVTSSVCLTELNRRKRRAEVELLPQHIRQATLPDFDQSDLPGHLRRCIAKLSDQYAAVITMYYLKGISYDEITHTMGIPLGTLKTWMFRARKQLKRIVEKDLFADGAP